jgi:acetolactate synthase-1/3 small subunit
MALTDIFNARVVDVGPETLVFEVVGEPEELDSFEELVRPHGIRELARTGRIGLGRAPVRRAHLQRAVH